MKREINSQIPELQQEYREGKISRREFIRRVSLLGASLSTIGALLAACGTPVSQPSATTASFTPTKAPTPVPSAAPTPTGPSGELRIGVSTFAAENYDPVTMTRAGMMAMLAPIFDFLIRMDPSEKVNKGIAEKWEMAPDGLSWTFYIRKGIMWHDGSPLTAKDVKFSLERYGTSKDVADVSIRDSQDHVEIVDDYTVRVFTKGLQPYYQRWVNLVPGQSGMMVPKDYIDKNGMDYFKLHPVGTGPFKFIRHVGGDSVEYEALDKHYRQVPAFKKLTISLIPEEATRVAMLKTGAVDAIEIGVDSAPELEAAGLRAATMSANHQAFVAFLGAYDPRAKTMPIANDKVRQALSLAINREEIGRTFFYGKLQPPMPPTLWPNQAEIDVAYWKDQSAKYYRYDPEEAKRLLADAGYPQGFDIKLYSYIPVVAASYIPRLAPVIQGYWLKVGVRAEIVSVDYQGFFRPALKSGPNGGPADALVGQATMFGADGNVMPVRALLSYFGSKGTFNLSGGAIPELDRLIDSVMSEPDEAKRKDQVAKGLQIVMDTHTATVIGGVPQMAGLGPGVDIDFPMGALSIPMYAEIARRGKQS